MPDPFPTSTDSTGPVDLLSSLEKEVHVWVLDPDATGDDVCAWCEGVLSVEENERRRKFLRAADGRSFVLAHGLVRAVLSRYADIAAESWAFAVGEHGRPEIVHPHTPAGLRFNLSHTRGRIAVLVHSGRDAGIDVERLGRVDDPSALSLRFFTKEEHEVILSLPDEARDAHFVRLWTLKEAYVKARGLSLALHSKKLWFDTRDPNAIHVQFSDGFGDEASSWTFTASSSGDEFVIATAARRAADGCARSVRHLFT